MSIFDAKPIGWVAEAFRPKPKPKEDDLVDKVVRIVEDDEDRMWQKIDELTRSVRRR